MVRFTSSTVDMCLPNGRVDTGSSELDGTVGGSCSTRASSEDPVGRLDGVSVEPGL